MKSVADNSVIAYDEIISVMDIISTKMTNTLATNVLINRHNKKVRYEIDCYILQTVLLVIILVSTVIIICDHYARHRSKQKSVDAKRI